MVTNAEFDRWSAGRSYDHYMGRWSRLVAARFVDWLAAPKGADWLEVGCGTGALTEAILARAAPASILATDASDDFVAHARQAIDDPRVRFQSAAAQALPLPDQSVDVVTSGLVLNFVPNRLDGLIEMQRVVRPGGVVSFYVWDYPGGGIGFIDAFWKAAAQLDPAAAALDEGARFPFCTPEGLARLGAEAGLEGGEVVALAIDTPFPDFEAFWHPFTLGAGPAPGYCANLSAPAREALKARLRDRLGDGEIRLTARAWAFRAHRR